MASGCGGMFVLTNDRVRREQKLRKDADISYSRDFHGEIHQGRRFAIGVDVKAVKRASSNRECHLKSRRGRNFKKVGPRVSKSRDLEQRLAFPLSASYRHSDRRQPSCAVCEAFSGTLTPFCHGIAQTTALGMQNAPGSGVDGSEPEPHEPRQFPSASAPASLQVHREDKPIFTSCAFQRW